MALYYQDSSTKHGLPRNNSYGPAPTDEGFRVPADFALLESALIGALAGALVSVYWIIANQSAIIPSVLGFSAAFALAGLVLEIRRTQNT